MRHHLRHFERQSSAQAGNTFFSHCVGLQYCNGISCSSVTVNSTSRATSATLACKMSWHTRCAKHRIRVADTMLQTQVGWSSIRLGLGCQMVAGPVVPQARSRPEHHQRADILGMSPAKKALRRPKETQARSPKKPASAGALRQLHDIGHPLNMCMCRCSSPATTDVRLPSPLTEKASEDRAAKHAASCRARDACQARSQGHNK